MLSPYILFAGDCVDNYIAVECQDYYADEIGVLSPNQLQVDQLYAGEVQSYIWLTLLTGLCRLAFR